MRFPNPFHRRSSSQGYGSSIPTIPSLVQSPPLTKPEDKLNDDKRLDRPSSRLSYPSNSSTHVKVHSRDFAAQSPIIKGNTKADDKGKAPEGSPTWILDAEAEITRLERNSSSLPPSPNPARSSSSPLLLSRPQSKDKSTKSRPTSASSSPFLFRPAEPQPNSEELDATEPSPRPSSRGWLQRLSSWASTTLSASSRSRRNTDSSSLDGAGHPPLAPLTPISSTAQPAKLHRKQRRELKRQQKWEREQERRAEEMIERYSSQEDSRSRSVSDGGGGGNGNGNEQNQDRGLRRGGAENVAGCAEVGWW